MNIFDGMLEVRRKVVYPDGTGSISDYFPVSLEAVRREWPEVPADREAAVQFINEDGDILEWLDGNVLPSTFSLHEEHWDPPEELMTGKWRGAGVFNMEQLDPDPFMEALNQHGLPWELMRLEHGMD